MRLEIGIATPPHREEAVAEFRIHHDRGGISLPAEMYREGGRLKLAIYNSGGGIAWEFGLADLLEAIGRGIALIEQ
jgi:hypothetical protein